MSSSPELQLGLVLSGGGARGAYQAGAIQALQEIHQSSGIPFSKIICGVSAGAINASYIASQIDQPDVGASRLHRTWSSIQAEEVFRTDYTSLTRNALKLVRGVSLGGLSQSLRPLQMGLLNTTPLRELLEREVPFSRIEENLSSKKLTGLAVSATDYSTSFGVTYVQAHREQKMWHSANRFSLSTDITADHIMASSAIPLFFPPVKVDQRYYGDGCLRNTAPLAPAVHMGANKILVVGVRNQKHIEDFDKPSSSPSLGRVLSVLINAIFMDAVEVDLERLRIVNESVRKFKAQGVDVRQKRIDALYLHPSKDLAQMAQTRSQDLPAIIRYLFAGLGTPEESAELLSYLLFEPSYCTALFDLGYHDTKRKQSEILKFLEE